jgi:uncharacterized sulfatase
MRSESGVQSGAAALRSALSDNSPYVRIVAAQALAQFGAESDLQPSLAVLGELAPAESNGVFVSMAALNAIEALGKKAAPLLEVVQTMKPQGPSPDARFNSYVPRLVANITDQLGAAPENAGPNRQRRANPNRRSRQP